MSTTLESTESVVTMEFDSMQVIRNVRKLSAWVQYVLRHANYNGWEEFTMTVKGTDVVKSASVRSFTGSYVFSSGEPMNLRYAMALSKQYWSPREQKGLRKDLWDHFDAQYK